jgi:hypothetical protein
MLTRAVDRTAQCLIVKQEPGYVKINKEEDFIKKITNNLHDLVMSLG